MRTEAIARDVAAIQRIGSVPKILSAVADITGMRFAAVARVTETDWTVCSVIDDLGFGLETGDELEVCTTICNEIRTHHQPVVFGNAAQHPVYAHHPTPRLYGLESYISVPIFRGDGSFFGTLCAIDRRPAAVEAPGVVKSLQLFADLIGMQLELLDDLETAHAQRRESESRERLFELTEREVRDLLQPVVTIMYLLRSSSTLADGDRMLLDEMHRSCEQISDRLEHRIGTAFASPARADL